MTPFHTLNLRKDVYVALKLPHGGDPSKQYLEAELTYQHQVEYLITNASTYFA